MEVVGKCLYFVMSYMKQTKTVNKLSKVRSAMTLIFFAFLAKVDVYITEWQVLKTSVRGNILGCYKRKLTNLDKRDTTGNYFCDTINSFVWQVGTFCEVITLSNKSDLLSGYMILTVYSKKRLC